MQVWQILLIFIVEAFGIDFVIKRVTGKDTFWWARNKRYVAEVLNVLK